MFLWFHIILALTLIVLLVLDLIRKNGSKVISMIIRIIYLLMILDGLWLLPKAWGRNPILALEKIIFSILVIGYFEYLLMRRSKNQLNKKDIIILGIVLILLIILGLFTAGFRPWINF